MNRVILMVPSFPKLSETFIVNKVRGLLDRGWDIHVVCSKSDSSLWAHFPEMCQRDIHRRIHVSWPHRPRSLAILLFLFALVRCFLSQPQLAWRYLWQGKNLFGWVGILRRFYLDADLIVLKPNVVHFEFGALAVERVYLKRLLNCKLVVSFRGYDLNYVGLDNPNYYREVWEHADALHLLGKSLWQRALLRGCSPSHLHSLISPAIDVAFFAPGERRSSDVIGTMAQPLRILSVGRLEWKKGYEYALQAVKLLLDQGIQCEYHIVGDGAYLEAIAYARHQLGLDDTVQLLGALPHSEVRLQMRWADLFLHAAVSEGFCNAVIEAQAMSLPVVCTDADGLAENVLDGQTGLVVPRRNSQALADALIQLAHDPRRRQQIGQLGRQRVETHFRLEDQISALERLYEQALNND